ncbi:hypothetical protein PCK1_001121 [Pneumocystis canis]|nr:hypothetical protein PCK1_001121 [Pneumocystis canis]
MVFISANRTIIKDLINNYRHYLDRRRRKNILKKSIFSSYRFLEIIMHKDCKKLEINHDDTRLLIVSNRLPITIKRKNKGEYEFSVSSGGLVSALSGLKKTISFLWIGWPGVEIPESEQEHVVSKLMQEYNALPVFMDDELADRHYNGFSNSILWPLFHYHPDEIRFDEPTWDAYREANCTFAKLICSIVQNGDLIWVQDYHLMLLPAMLREEMDKKYQNGLKQPKVIERIKALEKKFQNIKIIVGVDRLDYIKGVPQKLHALEFFLTEHPEWIGKVVLVQVAVPSRQDVEEYQNLRAIVNELVGRINGKFGTIEFMPIHFIHKSISFDELIALYAVSDICLVSSTRDGMNLVSYEYICTQQDRHGVMILSEFAGAAQSLNGSLIVNPWNVTELAGAIYDAITMPENLRKSNHEKLYRYVNKYTSSFWGHSFVNELKRISLNIAIEHEQRGDILEAILIYQSILKVAEQNSHTFKKSTIWYYEEPEKQMEEMIETFCSQAKSKISTLSSSCSFKPYKSIGHISKEIGEYYFSFLRKIQQTSNFQKQKNIIGQSLQISSPNKNIFFENLFKSKSIKKEESPKEHLSQIKKNSQPKQFPQTLRKTKSRPSLMQNNAGKAALYAWNTGTNPIIHSMKTNETNGDNSQQLNELATQFSSSIFSISHKKSLNKSQISRTYSTLGEVQLNDSVNSQYIGKNDMINELSNPTFKQHSLFYEQPISTSPVSVYASDLNSLAAQSLSRGPQKNISSNTSEKFMQNNTSLSSIPPNILNRTCSKTYKEQFINTNSLKNQNHQNEMTLIHNNLKDTSLGSQNIDRKADTNGIKETREQREINNLKSIIDENLLQTIVNDIVVKGEEVLWEDIAGLEEAKKTLKETVIYPLLRPDLFSGLREPATGVLLFGPPGTGKTMLAKAAATQAKSTFFSISASSLTSKFLGESEKLVRALFALAKELSPSIIFVDEIDALLSYRREDGNEHEASRRLKTEFLIQWSSLATAVVGKESEPISRVLVLAATNIPWSIDEAARRRFSRRQYIPLPERDTRMQQILHLLKYQTHTLSNKDIQNLVDITEGYSGSDITALTKDAAMGPLRCLGEALLTTERDLIRPICLDDFKASLRLIRPSISQKGLIEFEKFNKEFGIQS